MLSYSDLLQLAGYTAVEYCGGPSMIFRMGREDIKSEGDASNALAITEHEHENAVMVRKFGHLGLSAEEHVALMGSYTLGFATEEDKTRMGRWTMNPYVFDNTYFKEVLLGHKSKYLKTAADLDLLENEETRTWVEKYAEDQDLFFTNYARAHVKVSEMGQESRLLSEFDPSDIVDGGYQEFGGHWSENRIDVDFEAFGK